MKLTFAFCTYNRADRLEKLVAAMRAQACPMPFEILAVNNNSKDDTLTVLQKLAALPGVPLRYVTETAQGIVPARNRAIEEALSSDILVFIDDDELPSSSLLTAACNAILHEGADCVGGPITVDFRDTGRPAWLDNEIVGFLGELNHGERAFWVRDDSTPIWSGNISYNMKIFRDNSELRFDRRYNREGSGVGGGEDAMMFRALLGRHAKILYQPDMLVEHLVEPWRLSRRYFLRLHYSAGVRYGRYGHHNYARRIWGVPPFMISQALTHTVKAMLMYVGQRPHALRQAMNAAHAWGAIRGIRQQWLEGA